VPDPSDHPDDDDRVVLRVPADPRYARVVRIATTSYTVRLGLPAASVEDLRLAVDEALILLLGIADATTPGPLPEPTAHVVVTLDAADDRPPVTIDLRLDPSPTAGAPDPTTLARFEELIPAGVSVGQVDAEAGRVTLRHPR
jgi:hypothetical protein